MFDKRQDIVKFLAVAEAGKILAAAERLSIGQPALTRAIARLEKRLGGRLFERLPTGVRPTPLGAAAVELARGLLHEIEAADEKIKAAVSGRTGRFRITATPVWMQAIVAPALARYREALPDIELALRTAPFAEGLRLLENGESDLHCGGADPGRLLPAFLRRERFIELTAGIVAGDGHPLLTRRPAVRDLPGYPWIDYDAPAFTAPATGLPGDMESSLDPVLERLFRETGRRVSTVLHAGAAALLPMAAGPWLARLPLELLDRLAEPRPRPLSTRFGRQRYRTGLIVRRSAEDLAPFRALEKSLRETALERSNLSPNQGVW